MRMSPTMQTAGRISRAGALAALLAALLMTDGCASTTAPGQPREATASESWPANPEVSYDARLTSYPYPFPVRTFSIESQGQTLELAYMDVSPRQPNGRTVLLLHGKNFSGAYWRRTIVALSDEGFRVIVPDQVGFGKSSKPVDFQYSFQALAVHTKQLLDHLGVERTAVVGHSMGGMVATRFALMYPKFVDRLALVDPIGLEDWKRVVPYIPVEEGWARERKQTPDSIKTYMQENYFHGQWKPEYDELLEIQAGWIRGPDHRQIARVAALTTDMIFTQPVLYEFGQIKVPTLLMIGQLDRTALGKKDVAPEIAKTLGNYPELGREAARAIPGAVLVELPGVGHIPQYESFDAYFTALDNFLR
jgi:pimeloyl-ACP methyl ester carboxylesterase